MAQTERMRARPARLRQPVDRRPRAPADLVAWIGQGRQPFTGYCVASLVPDVFAVYARILHPAWSQDGAPVRWDAVAAWSGRTAHALAQWEHLSVPAGSRPDPPPFAEPPDAGGLPPPAWGILLDVLRRHTVTPHNVFMAAWDGYGQVPEGYAEAPVLDLEARSFLVRQGSLIDALTLGQGPDGPQPVRPTQPTLLWPADRGWFLASDVDLDSTYLGASRAAIGDVLAQAGLEAWEISPRDGISVVSDTLNPPGS
jgi:hypothetical protein